MDKTSHSALLVIDAQDSFRHRPYFTADDLPAYLSQQQALIDGAARKSIPIIQIFHLEDHGPFAESSGFIKTLAPLKLTPDQVFYKRRHSAIVGTGLSVWLTQNNINHLLISGIRTEQCCETTTRHTSDLGYKVDFISEATLTFAMTASDGKQWSAAVIKERTELVLADRFARILTVAQALT